MNLQEDLLIKKIKEANSGAYFPTITPIELSTITDLYVEQETIFGVERHRIKTYLAILFMRSMRDFTDTDKGIYKSHNAVDPIVEICLTEIALRKRIRKQIRRFLDSPRWQYSSLIEKTWTCVYCGDNVTNDGEGFARRSHLESHSGALPVEVDDGFPFSQAHIRVARGHIVGCLCGLVRKESWIIHRSYFQKELNPNDFALLENGIRSRGNAQEFFKQFYCDH